MQLQPKNNFAILLLKRRCNYDQKTTLLYCFFFIYLFYLFIFILFKIYLQLTVNRKKEKNIYSLSKNDANLRQVSLKKHTHIYIYI